MKKLIVTMLSLAALVGVTWADDVAAFDSENFATATVGAKYPGENNTTPLWTTANTETNSVVKESDADGDSGGLSRTANYLAIEDSSAGGLVRAVDTTKSGDAQTTIYFDSIVKMTPADSVPEYDTGSTDKLIVFLWEQEKEVTTTTDDDLITDGDELSTTTTLEVSTNLVVLARGATENTLTTNIIDNVEVKAGEWYRLVIKPYNADQYQVWISQGSAQGDMKQAKAGDVGVFYSLANATRISSVGFQGTGSLNQLAFYATDPIHVAEEYVVKVTLPTDYEGKMNDVINYDLNNKGTFEGEIGDGYATTLPSSNIITLRAQVLEGWKIVGWDTDNNRICIDEDAAIYGYYYTTTIDLNGKTESYDTPIAIELKATTPVTPTVITVASVGKVTDLNVDGLAATFKVAEGSKLASITIGGTVVSPLPTPDENGVYSITAEDVANVVIATEKIRTPVEHKWYENPVVKTMTAMPEGVAHESYKVYHADLSGDYFGFADYATDGGNADIYDIYDLNVGNATPIVSIESSTIASTSAGIGISPALNVALIGSRADSTLTSIPLNAAPTEDNTFQITLDDGKGNAFDAKLYDLEFTQDGQFLYGLAEGDTKVYKFAVKKGLKSSGANLVKVAEYDFVGEPRGIEYAKIGANEYVFAVIPSVVENGKWCAAMYNVTSGTSSTELFTVGGKYADVVISGIDATSATITVTSANVNPFPNFLDVYKLSVSEEGVVTLGQNVFSIDKAGLNEMLGTNIDGNQGFSAIPTYDDGTLYLGWGDGKIYAIEYGAPAKVVASVMGGTFGDNLSEATVTFKSYDAKTITFTSTHAADKIEKILVTKNDTAEFTEVAAATTYTYTYAEGDTSVAVEFVEKAAPIVTVNITVDSIAQEAQTFENSDGTKTIEIIAPNNADTVAATANDETIAGATIVDGKFTYTVPASEVNLTINLVVTFTDIPTVTVKATVNDIGQDDQTFNNSDGKKTIVYTSPLTDADTVVVTQQIGGGAVTTLENTTIVDGKYTYTVPESDSDVEVVITVTFSKTETDPPVTQPEVAPAEGTTTVEVAANSTTDAEAAVTVKAPTGVDQDTYAGYFNKTATSMGDGKFTVVVTLKDDVVKAEAETAEIAAVLDELATSAGDKLVTIQNAKHGLFYSVKYSNDVSTMKTTAARSKSVMAGSNGVSITLPKLTGNAMFYQIQVSTTDY